MARHSTYYLSMHLLNHMGGAKDRDIALYACANEQRRVGCNDVLPYMLHVRCMLHIRLVSGAFMGRHHIFEIARASSAKQHVYMRTVSKWITSKRGLSYYGYC
jgi:hypothetical protein